MSGDFCNHFRDLLQGCFPDNAEIFVRSENPGISLYIDWKLGSDSEHPNKRSRKIKIVITSTALEDYRSVEEDGKRHMDCRLVGFVSLKMESFIPEHDCPSHIPVPTDEWIITEKVIGL